MEEQEDVGALSRTLAWRWRVDGVDGVGVGVSYRVISRREAISVAQTLKQWSTVIVLANKAGYSEAEVRGSASPVASVALKAPRINYASCVCVLGPVRLHVSLCRWRVTFESWTTTPSVLQRACWCVMPFFPSCLQ